VEGVKKYLEKGGFLNLFRNGELKEKHLIKPLDGNQKKFLCRRLEGLRLCKEELKNSEFKKVVSSFAQENSIEKEELESLIWGDRDFCVLLEKLSVKKDRLLEKDEPYTENPWQTNYLTEGLGGDAYDPFSVDRGFPKEQEIEGSFINKRGCCEKKAWTPEEHKILIQLLLDSYKINGGLKAIIKPKELGKKIQSDLQRSFPNGFERKVRGIIGYLKSNGYLELFYNGKLKKEDLLKPLDFSQRAFLERHLKPLLLLRDQRLCYLVPESFKNINSFPAKSNLGLLKEEDLKLPPIDQFKRELDSIDLDESFFASL
jgi:hypothetical protein